jgi:hypothetical protein
MTLRTCCCVYTVTDNFILEIDNKKVLFITEVVVATCVDAVSGAIVASQIHRRARALPFALHADNFFAYIYYSEKHRRNEIGKFYYFANLFMFYFSSNFKYWYKKLSFVFLFFKRLNC